MNDITYAVSVDVNNPIIPYNVYVASVLDSNVRYLEITLYENGNIITLSNTATATASLVTDNVLVNGSVNCTISDSIITVPLEDLQRHGNLDVQVTVTEGTKVLAIPFPIQVRVTPNIAENAQIDENSLGSYAEVVQEIAAARGTHTTLHDAITAKLDDADGSVKENNIADESITVEKVADDLAAVINAKEVKSNKKTTLTGNESSNDFYPTTKAVADALEVVQAEIRTIIDESLAEEVGDLKSTISARDKTLYNSVHYGKSVLTNSGYITTTGGIRSNASLGYSDIMPIPKDAKSITINRHGNFTGSAVAFYSEDVISESTFISGTPSPDNRTLYELPIDVDIPSNAMFFAFSSRIDTAATFDFDAQINFDLLTIVNDLSEVEANAPTFGTNIDIQNADLITASKYINTDGTQRTNNAFACSAMYEIPQDAKEILLSASGTIPTGCAVAFYYWNDFTENAFIGGIPVSSNIPSAEAITVKIPNGAKYVAFSGRTANTFLATILIKTVADFIKNKPHKGEYLSILGDSISSYQGYIPEGNAYYYPQTYLSDVECTWWKRLLNETGMNLLVNNSWSGSLMSGTSASVGLNRCENLDDGTHTPDHIIVFMGVNDFKYPRTLGECGLNSETYAVTNFSDAYYTALNRIRTKYPNAKLYLGTIMEFNYPNDGVSGFPIINGNDVNLIDFNNAIRKLADLYGAKVIEFTKCGITYFNKAVTLGDQAGLHPNANGHNVMFMEAVKHFA